jgi:hypothetical protein
VDKTAWKCYNSKIIKNKYTNNPTIMKKHNFFTSQRLVFMAGPETGGETSKEAGKKLPSSGNLEDVAKTKDYGEKTVKDAQTGLRVLEDAEELQGGDKAKKDGKNEEKKESPKPRGSIDIKDRALGYPELTNTNDEKFKKVVNQLVPKMKELIANAIKRGKRGADETEPKHNDMVGGNVDGKASFLLYDKDANPPSPYRVFQESEAKTEGQKVDLTEDEVKEKSKGYNEVKPPKAEIIEKAKAAFKQANKKDIDVADSVVVPVGNFDYLYIEDGKKGRLFNKKVA